MSKSINTSLFQRELVNEALKQSFIKLNPKTMFRNPVMFTVEIGTAIMLVVTLYSAFSGDQSQGSFAYNLIVFLVLLLTLLFANFAEAIAEARGKAQADSLRKTREETPAKLANGTTVYFFTTKEGRCVSLRSGRYYPHRWRNY
jgi:K+-transporting ATPase ATPase B chain